MIKHVWNVCHENRNKQVKAAMAVYRDDTCQDKMVGQILSILCQKVIQFFQLPNFKLRYSVSRDTNQNFLIFSGRTRLSSYNYKKLSLYKLVYKNLFLTKKTLTYLILVWVVSF